MRVAVLLLAAVAAAAAAAASPEDGPRAQFAARRPHELDSFSYLLPRLRYRPWSDAQDEYTEETGDANEQDPELGSEERFKRGGPSLSIVNPLDVLRQRLLLEIARRQMRESSRQVAENRKLMKAIGKRGQTFLRQPDHRVNSIGYDTM